MEGHPILIDYSYELFYQRRGDNTLVHAGSFSWFERPARVIFDSEEQRGRFQKLGLSLIVLVQDREAKKDGVDVLSLESSEPLIQAIHSLKPWIHLFSIKEFREDFPGLRLVVDPHYRDPPPPGKYFRLSSDGEWYDLFPQ